jgi:F420-non-reducing hydrogenase iron-sulfur subunit
MLKEWVNWKMANKGPFEPNIMGFLCNWCCYAAADSAGISRFQYPPNIRVIRIMCTGRMDPLFIIEAFRAGIDGVFVGGWQLGECHYQVGNYDAIVTAHFGRRLLKNAGVNPDRFALDWASAAEAPLYVELITKFTDKIKELGPLGKTEGIPLENLKLRLSMAKSIASSVKLRTRFARLTQDLRQGNDYSPQLIETKISEKLDDAILREMEKQESVFSP